MDWEHHYYTSYARCHTIKHWLFCFGFALICYWTHLNKWNGKLLKKNTLEARLLKRHLLNSLNRKWKKWFWTVLLDRCSYSIERHFTKDKYKCWNSYAENTTSINKIPPAKYGTWDIEILYNIYPQSKIHICNNDQGIYESSKHVEK